VAKSQNIKQDPIPEENQCPLINAFHTHRQQMKRRNKWLTRSRKRPKSAIAPQAQ
jgi:hypothetical protein